MGEEMRKVPDYSDSEVERPVEPTANNAVLVEPTKSPTPASGNFEANSAGASSDSGTGGAIGGTCGGLALIFGAVYYYYYLKKVKREEKALDEVNYANEKHVEMGDFRSSLGPASGGDVENP